MLDSRFDRRRASVPQQEIWFSKLGRTRDEFDHHTIGKDFASRSDATVRRVRLPLRLDFRFAVQSDLLADARAVYKTNDHLVANKSHIFAEAEIQKLHSETLLLSRAGGTSCRFGCK